MSQEEVEFMLEKGVWFSIIPKSKDKWKCIIYKRTGDSWSGTKHKTHPSIAVATEWVSKVLVDILDEQDR